MYFVNINETVTKDQKIQFEIVQKDFKLLAGLVAGTVVYYVLWLFLNSTAWYDIILFLIPFFVYYYLFPKELYETYLKYEKAQALKKRIVKTGTFWKGDLRIIFEE